MKVLIHFTILYIMVFNIACKEVYRPEIEDVQKLLVVDGLLTDENEVITVKLSKTVPFQVEENDPEIGAKVIVSDDTGKDFVFIERPPGIYKSKAFKYEYDRIYVLNIETKNGKKYRSSPQKLYHGVEFEPVTFVIKSKPLQTIVGNKPTEKNYNGIELSTLIKPKSDESPYYRFSNCVLVEYTEKMNWVPNNDSIPGLYYGWKKYYPNETFNLNDSKLNNIEENKHSLAFCPIDTNYFSIINEELIFNKRLVWFKVNSLYYFAITVKKYHINSDVYQYYKDLNVQLEAKNRIFDPISFQVRGNIFCVSDMEEPVLGVFEVSSVMARTYSFSDFQADKSVKFKQIEILDIESIPLNGILYNQYPPFWVYYYLYR